jgi:CDP-paratose 2-epimerase
LGHKEISERRLLYNYDELKKMKVEIHDHDIYDRKTWCSLYQSPDVIFHMAAQCGVPTSINNPRRDFEVNTVGTLNMLEYARNHESRVVYASTNKVYPIHSEWYKSEIDNRWHWISPMIDGRGWPVTAMDNVGSRTPYGTSKFAGDLLCQEYSRTFGVPTGVFRMSCIYGENQFGFEEQGWATWFAIATLKGLDINIYGDGCQVRDMLFVEDLVRAYNIYAQSNIHHKVWNIGGGPKFTLSLNECLDHLEDITGKRSKVHYHDWRPSDQKVYTSDIRNLYEDLAWEPNIKPRKGLERIVKWVEPILEVF